MILVEADSEIRIFDFPIFGAARFISELTNRHQQRLRLPPIRVNSPSCPSWSSQELQGSP